MAVVWVLPEAKVWLKSRIWLSRLLKHKNMKIKIQITFRKDLAKNNFVYDRDFPKAWVGFSKTMGGPKPWVGFSKTLGGVFPASPLSYDFKPEKYFPPMGDPFIADGGGSTD